MGVNDVVQAAGGVISRRGKSGEIDVLLIYRVREQSDWSFPKGKVEDGETHEMCALREVREETGLSCALGNELPSVFYRDRRGREKIVRYWTMQVVSGEAKAYNEVHSVRWMDLNSARTLLTYPRDRDLLAAFSALVFQGDFA